MGGTPEQEVWAIRFTERARDDVRKTEHYVAATAGEEIAFLWLEGFDREIALLAQFPARLPVVPENDLFSETVRGLLYRRIRRGPAYRVFVVLREALDDAPTVAIIHVRHSAQAPMTQSEAQEIEASE